MGEVVGVHQVKQQVEKSPRKRENLENTNLFQKKNPYKVLISTICCHLFKPRVRLELEKYVVDILTRLQGIA